MKQEKVTYKFDHFLDTFVLKYCPQVYSKLWTHGYCLHDRRPPGIAMLTSMISTFLIF